MSESPKRFGRVWSIVVDDINGNNLFTVETPKDNPFTPEQLHITFDTTQTIQQGFWYCDVSIYNLTSKLMNAVILQGMKLTLSAGYKSDNLLAILFQGSVLQPIFTRENGVDWKLTLHCVCGLIEVTNNFVAQTIAGGITQRQITAQMANACHFKLDASDIKDVDDKNKVSRASSFFGSPVDFFQEIAHTNNSNLWFSNMAVHIRQLREDKTVPTISYSPTDGLIGTPQQTQDGVEMRVLLDPRIQLMTQIKLLPSVTVNMLQRNIGSLPTVLSPNYTYIVGRIRHHGDSRGNDWYTEATGFVNAASLLSLQDESYA